MPKPENAIPKEEMPVLKMDWATFESAKYACEHWHYSGCMPAGKMVKIGAWEDDKFIGVVIFSYGATNNIGKPYDLTQTEICELTRIALRGHKHFVSEIMMKAIAFLHQSNQGVKMIVSYADPAHGHNGAIYQATNWIYQGRTEPQRMWVAPNGKLVHARSIQAMRKQSKTTMKETEFAVSMGYTRKMDMGKYKYLMPLDKKTRKKLLQLARPYPKKDSASE